MHAVLMHDTRISEIIERSNTAYRRQTQYRIPWCAILGTGQSMPVHWARPKPRPISGRLCNIYIY